MFIIDLVLNLSLLAALCVLSDIIDKYAHRNTLSGKILQGILFGAISVIAMLKPLSLGQGLFFDGRSIIISQSGYFFGPISAIISGSAAIICRAIQGGIGAVMGISVIIESALVGSAFYLIRKRSNSPFRFRDIVYLGIIVHIAMFFLAFTLPYPIAIKTLKNVGFAILVIYPLASFVTGKILADQAAKGKYLKLHLKSQSTLRMTEERFELAMAAVNDGLWDWNIKQNEVYFDSRYYTMAGYEPREFPSHFDEWKKRVHPDDIEHSIAEIEAHFSGKTKIFDMEFRFLKKDGSWMWIQGRGKIVEFDELGNPVRMVGTHTDITERKFVEIELAEKQRLLEDVIENSGTLIVIKDRDGAYLLINSKWEEITGLKRETTLGKTDMMLFPVEVAKPFRENDLRVINTGAIVQTEETLPTPSGNRYFISNKFPLYNAEGKITGVCGVITEVTERKIMENDIIELNTSLEEKVVERTAQLAAANEELDSANQTLLESNAQLENTLQELQDTQDKLLLSAKMAALGQLVSGIAHEINTPLGAIIAANDLMTKFISPLQNIFAFYRQLNPHESVLFDELLDSALHFDFTSSKPFSPDRKLKKQLVEIAISQNLSEPEQLIEKLLNIGFQAGIPELHSLLKIRKAEEIINAVYSLAVFIQSSEIIKTAGARIKGMINSLKTYTYHDNENAKMPTDIIKGIELVLTIYYNQYKYGVEIRKNFVPVQPVPAYPEKLNQVWMNIMNNALQAIKYRGVIEINIKEDEEWVVVSFTDNGHGIPEDIHKKIFIPFFTTKKAGEGTGLGLDMCKKILNEIGGNISFTSEPGKTTFTVCLKKSTG